MRDIYIYIYIYHKVIIWFCVYTRLNVHIPCEVVYTSVPFSGRVTLNMYRKVSNIRRTFVGNKIVDHSDVVGASAVGAAPTTSSFST